MSEAIDEITASKQKLQFSAEYSVLFAPFLREILSRTPKSAFKLPETADGTKNHLDDFLNEQKAWLGANSQTVSLLTDYRVSFLG